MASLSDSLVRQLLDDRHIATLAAQNPDGSIHMVAVWRVGPVFSAWDDVTIQIAPASVIAWDMRQADRQFFDGVLDKNPAYLLPLQR